MLVLAEGFFNLAITIFERWECEYMQKVRELLEAKLNEETFRVIISNPRKKQVAKKLVFRPYQDKGCLMFQRETYENKQVFHDNMDKETTLEEICAGLEQAYRQMNLQCEDVSYTVLVSKKGKATIKIEKGQAGRKIELSHNRKKQYILDGSEPIPFLVDLGVQTKEGKIVQKMYKKYKQINRFLEFIRDVLPELRALGQPEMPLRIIDFGCGKSYLTFAVYYYLKIMNGLDVEMIGLDLKTDVISHCNELSQKYGYEDLKFLQGDIASYEGTDRVDMVITLHACDNATDFALDKAVKWGAKVILSVPCCQHEINQQIENKLLQPLLKYGILRERFSALLTDALRANLLEQCGYKVQILEFIDMEHTPKNLLIRAVKANSTGNVTGGEKQAAAYQSLCKAMNAWGTLDELLKS